MALSPCDLCGRTFQAQSLSIHRRICKGKMPSRQSRETSLDDIYDEPDDGKAKPTETIRQAVGTNFVVCSICGKTYTVHSLAKHEEVCKKKADAERKEMEAQRRHDEGPKHVGRLPGAVCYICGRNFGTTSIDIHEKNCLEKFKKENDMLPKNERRALPIKPQTNKEVLEAMVKEQKLGGNAGYDMNAALNDANAKAYNQNLVPCPNCSRTFNPDAFKFHAKACTKKKPARKVGDEVHH